MNEAMSPFDALQACRKAAGSESQMARDLGTTQPKVWRWFNQAREIPAEYVLPAERLYGVSRHDLRPDLYPRNYPPAPEYRSEEEPAHRLSAVGK